jgi:O-antigen/teichoic acid export membrane protein
MATPETAAQGPRSLKRTVARNTLIVTLGSLSLKAINFLYNIAVVRVLGDSGFGQFSTVLAFVSLFAIVAELGVSQYVMREVAQRPEKTNLLFWNLMVLRVVLALLSVGGITIAATLYGFTPELVFGVFLYTLTFVYSAFLAPLETVLVASERFEYPTIITVIGQIGTAILGAIVLINNWGYLALIGVGLLAMIPQILVAVWAVRRHRLATRPIKVTPGLWPKMIRAGLPFGMIALSLTIAFGIDTVILARFYPPDDVGWYNAAYRLSTSLLFMFTAFNTAIVPSLSKAFITEPGTVERWYYRSVKIIMLTGIPMALGGMLVADPLIRFLYGDQYAPAVQVFQIIVWDVPVLMFASLCGNMTTIISQERAAARIYFIGAVANVVLNLLLIPRFGIIGAAVVTVVTDFVAAGQFHFLLRRQLKLPNVKPLLLKVAVTSALMGVVVVLASHQHLFVQIALGAAVYVGLVLAFRLLDAEEWALINRVVNKIRLAPSKA